MEHHNPDDYQRIARAISWLQDNYRSQPSLADAAASVHLSEYHFQRLFTQWAGISPKRFVQFLTAEYAREQLAEKTPILDAALDAGLSGSNRLHSLFCSITAMTPAEYRDGGQYLSLRAGIATSPFGHCIVAQTERGICHLSFVDTAEPSIELVRATLADEFPNASLEIDAAGAQRIANQVFEPLTDGESGSLSVHVKGTNFQLQVWNALLKTASGDLLSYGDIAAGIGRQSASRACGTAIGQNKIAYLIPCHRVIRASGELSSYRWGVERKRALIGWEAAANSQGAECA